MNRSASVRGGVGSKGEGRASTSRSASSRWGSSSSRMSWGWRSGLSASERSSVRSVGSARASAKDLMKLATNSNSTPSIKEAEKLALADWGGCQGPSGGAGAARDIWKEVLPAGSGGSGGGGAGIGNSALAAVRLRLRFVPIWDCLEVQYCIPSLVLLSPCGRLLYRVLGVLAVILCPPPHGSRNCG